MITCTHLANTRLGPCTPRVRNRGMILLLVVAILVLLAVMGTAYILMARVDRQSTYDATANANLGFAHNAVISLVQNAMLRQTIDGSGYIYGNSVPATSSQMSRPWDYPEIGQAATASPNTSGGYGVGYSNADNYIPDQPWLTPALPWEPNTTYAAGNQVTYAGTAGSGLYVCVANYTSSTTPPPGDSGHWEAITAAAGASGYSPEPVCSVLQAGLYDTNDGYYDIQPQWTGGPTNLLPPGVTAQGTVAVPNASIVLPHWALSGGSYVPAGSPDGIWSLLPYSSPNGTRYRYAVRIVDLSAMLNLNTGYLPYSGGPAADLYGTYLTGCPIFSSSGYSNSTSDTPSYMQVGGNGVYGRAGTYGTYALLDWQNQMFRYESPSQPLAMLGSNSELELLTNGTAGSAFYGTAMGVNVRASTLWPNTLPAGSAARAFYTTTSWSRNYMPVTPGNLGVTPFTVSGQTSWQYPRVVDLNGDVQTTDYSGNSGTTQMANIAANLATAVYACGFDKYPGTLSGGSALPAAAEGREMAVNYLTYRFDQGSVSSGMYSLPNGPCWMDGSGVLHIHATVNGTAEAADIATNMGDGNIYAGFAAQPFLCHLEFAVQVQSSAPQQTITNWAIQMANPFPVGLSLAGWQLRWLNTSYALQGSTATLTSTWANGGIAASTSASPTPYNVLVMKSGFTVNASAQSATVASGTLPTSSIPLQGIVQLLRPVSTASGAVSYVVVDQMSYDVSALPSPMPSSPTTYYYNFERDGTTVPVWGCDSAAEAPSGASLIPAADLGIADTATVTPSGVPLYDHFANATGGVLPPNATTPVAMDANDDLFNMADFNQIMRRCNVVDSSGYHALPVSAQVQNAGTSGTGINAYVPTSSTAAFPTFAQEAQDAQLFFDFAYDPRASMTTANAAAATPQYNNILSMVSMTDRTSYTSINVGEGTSSVDKVRVPGRININTASENVLATAFSNIVGTALPTGTGISVQQMVADVIAYRNRLPQGNLYVLGASTPMPGYAEGIYPNGYIGYGFRSVGEMLNAFLPTLFSGSPAPTSFTQRDAAWADVANFCTTQSDTFAVYGVIEALKPNGNYTATTAVQPADWYNAQQNFINLTSPTMGTISTDSNSAGAEFILEGSRRFISILDRSMCNIGPSESGTTVNDPAAVYRLPQVIAEKTLPN